MDKFLEKVKTNFSGKTNYIFPKDEIPSSKKTSTWFKEYAQAILYLYFKGDTLIPYSATKNLQDLRDFGNGCQSTERYKEIVNEWELDEAEQQAYSNLDYTVFSPMPKFKSVYLGYMNSFDFKATANAIDPYSTTRRLNVKWNTYYQKEFFNKNKQLNDKLGVETPDLEYIPENKAELEMFDRLGGFKLIEELAIEELLDHSFYVSEWQDLKSKMNSDIFDMKFGGCKIFTDPSDYKVKARYVDPIYYIGQYNRSSGFNNQKFAGEIIPMKIHQIKKEYPGVSEDELKKLALQFSGGKYGNPEILNWGMTNSDKDNPTYDWDNLTVYVLDLTLISTDQNVYVTRKNEDGEEIITEEKNGRIRGEKSNRKTDVIPLDVMYEGKIIIGTDIVFGFKKMNDIIKRKGEVLNPFIMATHEGISKTQSAKGLVNQLMLTMLQIQNLIANTAPPGFAIEYTALMNMDIKGVNNPLDIFKIYRKKGTLLYKATTAKGHPNMPGSSKPVTELNNDFGNRLKEMISYIEYLKAQIRDVTGINRIADASDPNPEDTYGASKLAAVGAAKALDPLYQAYLSINKRAAILMAIRGKDLITTNEDSYDAYLPIIGKGKLDALKLTEEYDPIDMGIKIELKPTEEMKANIERYMIELMKPGKSGIPLIEPQDALFASRMLDIGNLKFVEFYLSAKANKNAKQQDALEKENMKMNADLAQQTADKKAQDKKNLLIAETDEKVREAQELDKVDAIKGEREHNWKMDEIRLMNEFKGQESVAS